MRARWCSFLAFPHVAGFLPPSLFSFHFLFFSLFVIRLVLTRLLEFPAQISSSQLKSSRFVHFSVFDPFKFFMNASMFRSLQRFAFFMRGGEDCELLRQYYVQKDGREKGLEKKPVGHPLFVFEFIFSFFFCPLFLFCYSEGFAFFLPPPRKKRKERKRKRKEKKPRLVLSCLAVSPRVINFLG
jgi:hypothetical protein